MKKENNGTKKSYNQLFDLIYKINKVPRDKEEGKESKVIKKLTKFGEKLKPYQEEYMAALQDLRLDNAATDKDGVLITDENKDYKFTKEGFKKLNQQINDLGKKEFEFKPIDVLNPQGLESFIFLSGWTNGIPFDKVEEEEEL